MKLILPSRMHELRAIVDRVSSERGCRLEPDIKLVSLDAVKSLLLRDPAGRRTILPERSAQREVAAGALSAAPFVEVEMRRVIALTTPLNPRNAEAAEPISAWIAERAGSLKMIQPSRGREP
jgi:hypothetical protein